MKLKWHPIGIKLSTKVTHWTTVWTTRKLDMIFSLVVECIHVISPYNWHIHLCLVVVIKSIEDFTTFNAQHSRKSKCECGSIKLKYTICCYLSLIMYAPKERGLFRNTWCDMKSPDTIVLVWVIQISTNTEKYTYIKVTAWNLSLTVCCL